MKNGKSNLEKDLLLRKKAEEIILKQKRISPDTKLSYIETLELIHELDVHQIELEMQTEELLLAKNQAEIEADKFTELYDFAPSGYLTLSKEGEIMELNLMAAKLVGKERSHLINRRLALFVSDDTKETFSLFLDKLFESKTKETCEISLEVSGIKTDLNLTGISSENGEETFITLIDITESKKADEAMRLSEEKYRTLFESNRDSITIEKIEEGNKTSNFIEVNHATTSILGYTKAELTSLSIKDIDTATEKVRRERIEILQAKGKLDFETIFKTKDKKNRNVEVESVKIDYLGQPAVMKIMRDITERKQLEESTRKIYENMTSIIEAIPDLLFEVDLEGRIYYYHSHREHALTASPDLFTGRLFHEVLPADAADAILAALNEANEKGWSSGHQYDLELPQGKKCFELSVSPIAESNNKNKHFILIAREITERKQTQKELIKAKEKAEESDRLKSAFLANMSHEIRTPMNGIIGFTELLKESKLSGKTQQEYINIIEKSGARMLNIINDIINISKVEAGEVDVLLSETNVNEQIEYLHTFFSPEAKQKGIQIRFNTTLNSKEATIKTDCEKMYAILTNLVKNAIKFTNEGTVEFGYIKKVNFIEFYVKDSGVGISKHEQKFIFDRFRQVNESLSRNTAGSGLGLAISKAYIEMLGGEIWVESKVGKGSIFYFTIPYIKEQDIQKTIKADIPIHKMDTPIKKLKILIVEDDEISKLLMTIAVKKFAKEILKVSKGLDAIEMCRNNPDIDLVMMDINMPEMDGYEATGEIRKFNNDLIIIAQTANGLSTDRDNAINAGCTDYISKPVNIIALTELIEKYF
jgi:PAS domain S-box-containing protein